MKPDLYEQPVSPRDIRKFVNDILELAIADHIQSRIGKHYRRSGKELCDMFTSSCAVGHKRMASSIYNKVRWTLDRTYDG